MAGTSGSRIVADVDFDRNGRQHGFLRLFHSVHSSAYGFIPIPIVVLKNGTGPTALFVSGTHGDEYRGPGCAVQSREVTGPGAHPGARDHPAGRKLPGRDGGAAHIADRRGQFEPAVPG